MKTTYKNKRDQYQAEANTQRIEKERLQRELDSIKKTQAAPKKGFECEIYCSNCQTAYSAIVPYAGSVKDSGCAYCGKTGTGFFISLNKTKRY
ncbi:MAG: hypothetical protein UW18_C0017G0011 [Microgenomates group bacterium GW2011_GWF1_44_10]|nr:MAG: hypothetical protein UW18_C0017G0011 [Microgenomates group bacterium GW2011_GWF1_44_10]